MISKTVKRALIVILAVCMTLAAFSLSGCTMRSKHPTARITIVFNDEEYVLKYKLYRNMYPATVQHFIELADEGFYDNTIIHDYQTSDWFGGGYSYNAEVQVGADATVTEQTDYATQHTYAEYFESNSLENRYMDLYEAGTFTPSVFVPGLAGKEDCTKDNALPTLIGEFEANDHKVDNGALTSRFGALRMYYTPKSTTEKVPLLTGSGQFLGEHDYEYNSATSLFAIQVGTSSNLTTSDYCIFGVLKDDDSEDALNDLITAIADFIEDNSNTYDEEADFTVTVDDIHVDNREMISTDDIAQTVSYTVTDEPIIIREVKITKY